jgi:hypothetical protein
MTQARKISTKTYVCGVCRHESQHETNHEGEIYTYCKNCGNDVLYCKGNEPTGIETKLTVYRFDIGNEEEAAQYKKLYKKLKGKGYKIFDCISNHKNGFYDNLKKHPTVFVDTNSIFDNQWVSNLGRLMDWYEDIYPNNRIKQGYYLELTAAHHKLREPKNYIVKTFYDRVLIGIDTFKEINKYDAENKAYNKYVPSIENFDIWKYETTVELSQ